MKRAEYLILALGFILALCPRLAHLGGPLDEPMWRQTDTAYMARRMMAESPPDLLRPKAPYRGTNDVKAAEFPIYPFTASLAYKALGRESLPAARVVTLLFFLGATVLLGLAMAEMAGARAGWWAAVVYALLPLGIPYSRMVHPDFSIVFFSHLFFYGLLRYLNRGGIAWYAVAVAGGVGAFLMKAPYAFFFGLPAAAWVLLRRDGWTVRNVAALAFVLVLPLAAGIWFNQHRLALEAPFEPSLAYPMKWTAETTTTQFFGTLADRLDGERWLLVLRRAAILVGTPAGILLALAALAWPTREDARVRLSLAALAAGALVYVLLIFPMVSSGHEYYSIPLMAPVAALAAWPLARCAGRGGAGLLAASLALALIAAGSAYGLRRGPYLYRDPYFTVDWSRIEAGRAIAGHTRPDDLVLSITSGRSTGWSDPRILFHADRLGWTIEWEGIRPTNLATYVHAGADVAALFAAAGAPQDPGSYSALGSGFREAVELRDPSGQPLGRMLFFDLSSGSSAP